MTDHAATNGSTTGNGDRPGDLELLRRYAEARDEGAFGELVHRHVDFVYSAALRRLGGDAHSAADVAQQVFTALARRAATLARGAVLPGWLYATTRHLTADLVRAEHSRRNREREASTMHELNSTPPADAEWERLRPMLDQVIDELSESDRDAVLLRFFARRPFAEIGATLQVSEDAARMRVDRALDKLRLLLAKRDITSTSAALAAVLANQAAATAPAGLAASVTGAALSGAGVAEAGIVAAVIAFMTATKTTVTLGVAAALTIATAVYQSSEARTTAAALANAGRDHAAARDRVAELDAKVRAAEQALADREKIKTQLAAAAAAPSAPAAAATIAAEAAQQKALQQYLDSNPELQMFKAEYQQAYKRANHWPFFLGIGLTPEQLEPAQSLVEENYARKKARIDAGLKPPPGDEYAPFRAAYGDAAAKRWREFNNIRWDAGEIVCKLSAGLYFADEPFTAQQQARLIQVLTDARTTGKWANPIELLYNWDRILTQAEPVLSPVQMRGLRAQAGSVRMKQVWAAATKEAAAAAKK